MQDQVLATVQASRVRRLAAVMSLIALGALLVWLAVTPPSEPIFWQVFLIAGGAGAVWMGAQMHRATAFRIELTGTELRDSSGTVLARLEDIASVDRSPMAFKPSNGFVVRLKKPVGPRMWRPGLWWRAGHRIGVGGVTPASEGKAMADMMAGLLAERDQAPQTT